VSTLSRIWKLGRAVDPEEETLERLRRVVRQDPRSIQFAPLADLCRKRALLDEALSVCQLGVVHHPTYVTGILILARCYLDVGDRARALDAFKRVIELSPTNLAGHLGLSEVFEQEGMLAEARAHLMAAQKVGAGLADISERLERLERLLFSEMASLSDLAVLAPEVPSGGSVDPRILLRAKLSALEAYRIRCGQLRT